MSPTKYRKKPVVIEAMQWDGAAAGATPIIDWILATGERARRESPLPGSPARIAIDTLEGTMHATEGDYVIRGVVGEFYPCKPEIFAATYEPATPASSDSASAGVVDETAGGAETTGAVEAAAEAIHGSGGTSMSDEMTRGDLLTLIRAWGWTLTGSLPNGRADLWAHPGGMDEVVLPSDETAPDYDRMLRQAESIIARAEGVRMLAVVRDVQTVHARYFSTDVPPDHEDAGCEPEDVWRFDRDIRAALALPTETTEETNHEG